MKDEFVIIIFAVTTLLTGLTFFIVISHFSYRKKQLLNMAERERLLLKFQKELLVSEIEAKEQTMQTIGADLHDNIGQLLSLIAITLKSVKLDNVDSTGKKIAVAVDLTSRSIKELRQLGKLIQGDQLISEGLNEAILQEVGWLQKSGRFDVKYSGSEFPANNLSKEKDLILFRMFQEIVNNIIKHSEADQIKISLKHDGQYLDMNISDNGKGLTNDRRAERTGLGLQTLRKRAQLIGAAIDSWPVTGGGLGYTVHILYP